MIPKLPRQLLKTAGICNLVSGIELIQSEYGNIQGFNLLAGFFMSSIEFAELFQKQEKLNQHPVFSLIQNRDDLRTFMSWHVFAVWDFMSLTKRLQYELTGIGTPWLPPANPLAARLINEIVLAEESDDLPDGGYASHFEIYLQAMLEVGADSLGITKFIAHMRQNHELDTALEASAVVRPAAEFVSQTLDTAQNGTLHEVMGSFFFGRESCIPGMFRGLLSQWGINENEAPMFVYYLKRHIELDGDSHGPAALQLIETLVDGDRLAQQKLINAGHKAIDSRIRFWDQLQLVLNSDTADLLNGTS